MSASSRNTDLLPTFSKQIKNDINSSYITQSFQEQHQIKAFICSTKLIKIIESICEDFVKNLRVSESRQEDNFNAIIFKLPFVYSDFIHYSLDLLQFILDEPIEFANCVKYSVFGLVRNIFKDLTKSLENYGSAFDIDIDQVHILISFIGLPLQSDLRFQPHLCSYRTGLSEVIGILSAVTEPSVVVIQSVWYCSASCGRNKIRSTSLEVPLCPSCQRPMNEYTKLRRSQNVRYLKILPAESLECPHKLNQTFRALKVRVLDYLYDFHLKIGDRYFIVGYYNYFSCKQEFEAWNLTTI